jgi:hypothetical protein
MPCDAILRHGPCALSVKRSCVTPLTTKAQPNAKVTLPQILERKPLEVDDQGSVLHHSTRNPV